MFTYFSRYSSIFVTLSLILASYPSRAIALPTTEINLRQFTNQTEIPLEYNNEPKPPIKPVPGGRR